MKLSELMNMPDHFAEYITKKPEMLIQFLAVRSPKELFAVLTMATNEKIKSAAVGLVLKTLNLNLKEPKQWAELVRKDLPKAYQLGPSIIDSGIQMIRTQKLKNTGASPEEVQYYIDTIEKLLKISFHLSMSDNVFGWQVIMQEDCATDLPIDFLEKGIKFVNREIKRLENRHEGNITEKERNEIEAKTGIATDLRKKIKKVLNEAKSRQFLIPEN